MRGVKPRKNGVVRKRGEDEYARQVVRVVQQGRHVDDQQRCEQHRAQTNHGRRPGDTLGATPWCRG